MLGSSCRAAARAISREEHGIGFDMKLQMAKLAQAKYGDRSEGYGKYFYGKERWLVVIVVAASNPR